MLDPYRLELAVKKRLTPRRFHHSLCVQRRAATLARIHGADWYKAAIAGLLHDICKDDPTAVQLKYLASHAILLDTFTLECPQVWHAITGAVWLEHELGIRDRELLDAVRAHTTGKPQMTLLEKVLFMADTTSEDRTFPGCEKLRRLAEEDLDRAVFLYLDWLVNHFEKEGRAMVEDTLQAHGYYKRYGREGDTWERFETEDE